MRVPVYRHSDPGPEGLLSRTGKDILALYDWLFGPPMTERDRVKYRAVKARAELRAMEMCLISSWNQDAAILQPEGLFDESADSQVTRISGPGRPRTEQQSCSAVERLLL